MVITPNGVEDLQIKCVNSIKTVQARILDTYSLERPEREWTAWGQYLDQPTDSKQVGVYGTSAALQILGLHQKDGQPYLLNKNSQSAKNLEDRLDYEKIHQGCKWLIDNYDDDDSLQRGKGDFTIVFKLCAFLEAIIPFANYYFKKDSAKFLSYTDTLWDRLIENKHESGWGNYYYDEREYDKILNPLATSMALHTLLEYKKYYNNNKYEKVLIWLTDKAHNKSKLFLKKIDLGEFVPDAYNIREEILTELALTLLVISKYNNQKDNKISEHLKKYISSLSKQLEKTLVMSPIDPHCWYICPFTIPSREKIEETSISYSNRYILLTVHPIIALSLMEAGKTKSNMDYLFNLISYYTKEIAERGFHVNAAGRAGTGDQLWVCKCLNKFASLDMESI